MASAAALVFITRGLGWYCTIISLLGGLLVAALTWGYALLDTTPFPGGLEPAPAGVADKSGRAKVFIILGLVAFLAILLALLVFPLEHSVNSSDAALSSLPISVVLFSLAVFFLCLAGDYLVSGDQPLRSPRSGFMRRLSGFFGDFSWTVCSLSVYLLLALLTLRIAFTARLTMWDPLVEMALAQVVGSALAWILTLRGNKASDSGGDGVEDAEVAR